MNVDQDLKILVKLPSRSRPDKLYDVLTKYISMASSKQRVVNYLLSIDLDDTSFTETKKEKIRALPNVTLCEGLSKSKIDACNRDMTEKIINSHDILILASDDMVPIENEWAEIVIKKFLDFFPNLDGVIHFNDGFQGKALCTMNIMGREYYKKFGYFYHPDYFSFFCDNEYTEVAKQLNSYVYDPRVIFKHEHPSNSKGKRDALYLKNESFWKQDEKTYCERKKLTKKTFDPKKINEGLKEKEFSCSK
jgi:hypothetical protein